MKNYLYINDLGFLKVWAFDAKMRFIIPEPERIDIYNLYVTYII